MISTPSPTAASLQEELAGLTGSGRQAFLRSLSQHARLLSLETSLASDALIVQGFSGSEALSRLFRFEIDCLATSAQYELKALLGGEASLRLRLADGRSRAFHGVVTAVQQLGSDGALAHYRLTLEPWLHALTLRRDSYVYQDKTVLEIIDEILKEYPDASYRFDVKGQLPKRSLAMQYRETDFDFIARLLAEEGLNFFFTHEDGQLSAAPGEDGRAMHARHCFVVFDNNETLPVCMQHVVRFRRAAATELEDSITLLSQRHQIAPNAVALSSWDYRTLKANTANDTVRARGRHVPPLEIYEGSGAYRYSNPDEGERIARARAESLELQSRISFGESSVRSFTAGTWFELRGDSGFAPSQSHEFVVLSVEHRGSNNLPPLSSSLPERDRIEAGTYRNHFTCVPRGTPVRPTYWVPKPNAPDAQIAQVVGLAGEETTTDRDHRVRIQFPWQRGECATAGQAQHPGGSNARGDETSGTWVRVAEPAAGSNWGAHFIPRIGQEVLVDFIGGDIDRPVITGQLYNGADTPPYHGADNHAGALSGIRSKEHAGSGFNHWTVDDTPGQLRQSVGSSYASSRLDVGYLIRQNGNMRGSYRGLGFELATDAWGTVRAKRGIFISTTSQTAASSAQLAAREAQRKLNAATQLTEGLSGASFRHQALPLSSVEGARQLIDSLSGNETADGHDVPAFMHAAALIDSQAGVSAATQASAVMFSGRDLALTAESAARMSAGQAVSMAAANVASLFTDAGGAKVIAAKEPVSVQAHSGAMDVVAEQALTVTSSNGNILIQARQEVLLAAGGGYIKLAGPNIDIHCPSAISVKGSTHDFLGPQNCSATLVKLPEAQAVNTDT